MAYKERPSSRARKVIMHNSSQEIVSASVLSDFIRKCDGNALYEARHNNTALRRFVLNALRFTSLYNGCIRRMLMRVHTICIPSRAGLAVKTMGCCVFSLGNGIRIRVFIVELLKMLRHD